MAPCTAHGPNVASAQGMQAGWVLPQARWANPRHKPVNRRNSARIYEAALRGLPTGPSGAAEPAKRKGTGERGPGSSGRGGGAVEAVRLRAGAARSSHGITVRLCAVATGCRRIHTFPPQPRPLHRLRAHGLHLPCRPEHGSRLLSCCHHSYGPTFVAAPIPSQVISSTQI